MNKLVHRHAANPWRDFMRNALIDWEDDGFGGDLAHWSPRADIHETDSAFVIRADVPGVDKKDINITFENGVLTVSGNRHYKHVEKEHGKVIHSERFSGEFRRSFALPKSIDAGKINAKMTDGVLVVTAPKTPASIATSINVE